jgi:hypothetical protein
VVGYSDSRRFGCLHPHEAMMPNQSPDPALASVTHPAGQGARHR